LLVWNARKSFAAWDASLVTAPVFSIFRVSSGTT